MAGVIGGVGVVAVCMLIGFGWEALTSRSKTAASAESAAASIGDRLSWVFMKVCALVLVVGGGAAVAFASGDVALLLGGIAAAAYGLYLLFPGDKWWIF